MRATIKDEESVQILLKDLDRRKVNPEVMDSLIAFNSGAATNIKLQAISRLTQQSPVFVLTGQQVGLFGGPLLTLYKAVSAIKAARYLSEKLKRDVLPVFWLQSEDQDLAEISATTVLSSNGQINVLGLKADEAKLNRKSVSKVQLGPEILSTIKQLEDGLSPLLNSDGVLRIIKESYLPSVSWTQAFSNLFKELFKDTELLFFDLNESGLKSGQVAKQVFKRSISELTQVESLLTKCTAHSNISGGVQVKPNSPLCFLDDDKGNRFRLTLNQEGKLEAPGQTGMSFSPGELIELVDSQPHRFSTSALLRPIVQDSLFPTLAYIGGDAELQYHRQLETLYPLFDLSPPLLLARDKFRLLGKKSKQIFDELGLEIEDYNLSNEKIGELLRVKGQPFGIDSSAHLLEVQREIEKLSDKFGIMIKEIDPTLEDPLRKTAATAINAFSQFLAKLNKASLQKDSVILNRIEKVRNLVFPQGKEQERELGLVSILARTGDSLIKTLEECGSTFDGAVQMLVIEEL